MLRKNLHLIISILVTIPAALMYGLFPEKVLPYLINIELFTIDLKSIFRVIMCLYLSMALIWIYGILRPEYWKFSTLLVLLFMGSLSLGRVISISVDGVPSMFFLLGFIGELVLAIFSYIQLRIYS